MKHLVALCLVFLALPAFAHLSHAPHAMHPFEAVVLTFVGCALVWIAMPLVKKIINHR